MLTWPDVMILIGRNKGTDAVQIARLGMSYAKFDVSVWTQFIGDIITVCPAREQGQVKFPKRKGEIHCIEPMLNNVVLINNASQHLDLSSEEFVVTQAAISIFRSLYERELMGNFGLFLIYQPRFPWRKSSLVFSLLAELDCIESTSPSLRRK